MDFFKKMLSNTPPPNRPNELWKHFSGTYFALRWGLVALALSMPFVLWLYGSYRYKLPLQPSMSAYFWAAFTEHCASFPMRTIFVGYLFAIGVGLLLYKGITNLEDNLLILAAICAAVVAIFPERLTIEENAELFKSCPAVQKWAAEHSSVTHFAAAILLFVLLSFVVWACAPKSLHFFPRDKSDVWYRRLYIIIAIMMTPIVFPLLGLFVAYLFGLMTHKWFFIEAAGVLTFGLYWAVKSVELAVSGLERDPDEALRRAGSPPPGGWGGFERTR